MSIIASISIVGYIARLIARLALYRLIGHFLPHSIVGLIVVAVVAMVAWKALSSRRSSRR